MKQFTAIIAIALAVFFCACGGDEPDNPNDKPNVEEPDTPVNPDKPDNPDNPDKPVVSNSPLKDFKVRDLALIYQGGKHRIDWTESQFEPYVTHKFADGTEDWIFDGYLFLEFWDGGEYQFTNGYGKKNATKAQWEWYLDRIFERGKSLDALNRVITEKKRRLGNPGFKHKIALTAVVPIPGTENWGELNRKQLDFRNTEDQRAAIEWFVDQLIKRFRTERYDNLTLYAIYWIAESTSGLNANLTNIAKEVISARNLDFIWIPYFNSQGARQWQSLGFDFAYYQPNYFFSDDIPYSRLTEACGFARNNGMGMELECDENALSQSTIKRQSRLSDYIDAFEKEEVYESSAIAYYTGNHMMLDMVQKPSESNQAIMDRMCKHITDRRKDVLGK